MIRARGFGMPVMKLVQLVWTIAFLLAACGATPTPSLPTLSEDIPPCAGVGTEATLAGSRTDPRLAWMVDSQGGRHEIVWPRGFTARFDPDLAVLDASGKVVYRAGDKIDGGCVTGGEDSPLLILPPN
jgi:hypothetical protein